MNSQYRCETCKFADNNDESNKIFGLKYCSTCDLTIEPIFIDQICLTGCASHSDFQNQREKQCGTCKHKGTRACSHHGYDDVPISCSYKLGIYAEEAMKNLNGTFIDVWTPEHDKQVMKKVLDELNAEWMRLCSLPIMHLEKFSMIGDKIAELRQGEQG